MRTFDRVLAPVCGTGSVLWCDCDAKALAPVARLFRLHWMFGKSHADKAEAALGRVCGRCGGGICYLCRRFRHARCTDRERSTSAQVTVMGRNCDHLRQDCDLRRRRLSRQESDE